MHRQDSAQVSTPQENSPVFRLTRTPEGLIYTGETLTYRITGLSPHNLDRLRVTLKANPGDQPTTFPIDTLDLYFSRAREGFAESCAKYLKAPQSIVMVELSLLIAALEAEWVAMREKGNTAAVPPTSDEEKKEALDTLKSKDLLEKNAGDFEGIGYIGDKVNKLIAYMAAVSRLFAEPLAVLVLSASYRSAGNLNIQQAAV